MTVPLKIKYRIPYDPSILLLGVYPQELKVEIQTDACTPMLTAASFTID